ncbi:MAG TPA: DUF6036 family nucleotidyltransferase [Gemmataceae bacterium]|nr:DUF6036 family nucleotidyltransferase [Gemmataceae bacterium]
MPQLANDLWSLVLDRHEVDPDQLVEAIEDQVRRGDLDFRSRLLIRDSLNALQQHWDPQRLAAWLKSCPKSDEIHGIWKEDFGEVGFPSLTRRIVETTRPETIQQMFREIGQKIHPRKPIRVYVGGSCALILGGLLSRRTEDIDIVDELPAELRQEHRLLDELNKRYDLHFGHFQSHYLPAGWQGRAHYLDDYGDLQVYLVDAYDVALSKLFSIRTKDLDDLRALMPRLDKQELTERFKRTTTAMLASEDLGKRAQHNWHILFGEQLPQ